LDKKAQRHRWRFVLIIPRLSFANGFLVRKDGTTARFETNSAWQIEINRPVTNRRVSASRI
jgi:hypothetical protein